jgi:hypothetical protein
MATRIDMIKPSLIRHLRNRTEGVAYLEFALVMPVLLMLALGGVELGRYLHAGQKTDKLTHTVVDLVAQAPSISVPELDQIMLASQHIMSPYPFNEDGAVIISCIGYNEYGQLRVKWQYAGGGELERQSRIGEVGQFPTLPDGFEVETRDNVIIAESFFSLDPIFNDLYMEPIEFYRTAFYLPRLGELDTLGQ